MAERDFDQSCASNYGRLVVQVFAVTGNLADDSDASRRVIGQVLDFLRGHLGT
jgi:hypothetical protein